MQGDVQRNVFQPEPSPQLRPVQADAVAKAAH